MEDGVAISEVGEVHAEKYGGAQNSNRTHESMERQGILKEEEQIERSALIQSEFFWISEIQNAKHFAKPRPMWVQKTEKRHATTNDEKEVTEQISGEENCSW